jgi:outer membrane protein assembly factor BamB
MKMKSTINRWVCLCFLYVLAPSALAADWPAFRGPAGDGIARDDKAPLYWAANKNIKWKVPLPAPGNSSPIISRGRVYITCATDSGTKRSLYCFDRQIGKPLWTKTIEVSAIDPTHKTNPYCASTPVADSEHVIVWHGSAGVFCYSPDGQELWKKDLGPQRHDWGYASSPIIHRGKVILNFGPGARTFLAALDIKTGDLLWKHDEPGGLSETDKRMVCSWSTPIIANVNGKPQILCAMPTRVIAANPADGSLLWFCSGLGTGRVDMVTPTPLVCGDIGIVSSGWVNGPSIAFKLGGSGDVTATHRLWLLKHTQSIGSGVVVDGKVYIMNAGPPTAQCIDCATGKVLWSAPVEGGASWGSLVMAAGRLYVTSRRGVTTVFAPNPEKFELLAMNDLGEPSNATPAISDGQIFLRTDRSLYCIGD